jgi:PAS domain S-box-containing protein
MPLAQPAPIDPAALLAEVPHAILATDERFVLTFWNRAAEKMLGWRAEDVLGRDVREVLRSASTEAERSQALATLAATGELRVERINHHRDGRRLWIQSDLVAMRDEAGRIKGYLHAKTDITERKRAEEELRRSEAYLAEGQRLSHTGSWAWDVATGDLFWSQEHFRIFGLDPQGEQPSYSASIQWIHPEDRSRVRRAFELATHERVDFQVEARIVLPDGTIRHIHSFAHPVFSDSGDLTEYVGTVIDCTEHKRAEHKLKDSERRFRLLAEAIPHHISTYLPDGSVGFWNQRLVDYTGLTVEELHQGGWVALHPGDVERCRKAWEEAWAHGTPYETEQRVRGRDGRYRRFLCRALPVRDDERSQLVEWFGTNTDIEDRKQAEEALQEARAELAHVTRLTTMGELAASLAHELNQPLAAVVANAGAAMRWLTRDQPNLGEAMHALERIVRDSKRASEVLGSTRAFLKHSTGHRTPVDLNESIGEVLVILEPEMMKHDIVPARRFAQDLPRVMGSKVELQQVVLNLALNAIEAMANVPWHPRELVIRSESHELNGTVLVAVQDSGAGFQQEKLDRLFDAFYTTKASGLGMGLSISRSIVEAHGGVLWAAMNASQGDDGAHGTTFQFVIPALREPL